jgi:ribosomal subunit interface protein
MMMDIATRNVQMGKSLREYVERRVGTALSRFSSRISRMRVTVSDLNGPRGGIDKRCTVEVHLASTGTLTADVADETLESAIGRAADRIARRVREELHRRWALKRRDRVSASGKEIE